LTTNRTSAEKKTDGRQQGPKNMEVNWFYMSREGQPLYYSTSDRNEYFFIPEQPQPIVTEIHKQPDVLNRIQSNMCKYVLKILDFNCKNILTCEPFFQELNNSIDIYLLQEHWLFDCQLNLLNEIHQQYTGVGKAVDSNDPITPLRMPRGYDGTAILWRKDIDTIVTPLTIGNNRIQSIELAIK
jgi:hypothetical protein